MNNLTHFTTAQLIQELIQRKLIEITPNRNINITEEFMNELRKLKTEQNV